MKKISKTDSGRTEIKVKGELEIVKECPTLARAKKKYWDLWKLARDLNPDEIKMLITKRKNDLKYEKDVEMIRDLRTEIKLLSDIYIIVERKRKGGK